MPKLGQHFLKNHGVLVLIASSLDIRDNDVVIEVGAGHGELTQELKTESLKLKSGGVKIIAIEKDPELAELLKKKFAGDSQIEIIEGDALKVIPRLVGSLKLQVTSYKLVGNIPYYLTGKLLRTIGELPNKPAVCVFTIQKEVAERIVAQPPHMNRLAASAGFWARAEIIGRLPRADFNPPPNVDSAIIKLTAMPLDTETNQKDYYRAVRALFSQPRKTVLNNLAGKKICSKEELIKKLRDINLEHNIRPQNLTLENIAQIARIF